MKVLDTKILNGKKLFLIEDTPIKAEAGVNANPYYVPIQGINSSDNLKTKLLPKKELTKEEIIQLKKSPTAAKNIAIKEEMAKAQRLDASQKAYQKRIKTGIQSSQDLADETGAIGDKISLQNIPHIGKYIPDMLDATGMIGNMASGLGRIPLNLEQRNYGQAALSVATPLTVGALAGIGTQNTGQFVNNIVNPLAGIKLKADLPEGTVQNGFSLSKLNERINLEPNELMGTNAYKIKLKDKWIGDFQLEKSLKDEGKIAIGNVYIKEPYRGKGFGKQVFTEGNKLLNDTEQGVLHSSGFFEGNDAKHVWNSLVKEGKAEQIGKDAWRFIEKSPSSKNFKSEIDWGKWNKEIPDNKPLMAEYHAIEQQTKANNTWMKNPDGSKFQGTPEQFVQQNSENFKKAFPKGYDKVYRGGNNETLENRPHPIVFTGDKATAQYYTGSSDFANTVATPTQESGRVLFDLYHPKSNNSIVINNQGKSWREIPRKYFGDNPPLRDLHNSKGDFTSTDDIAKWIVENDKNSVRLNNIFDSYDADFVNIINHKPGNYLKSAVGNNGMFDMTNPNIYKTVVGALATGTLGKQAMEKKEFGGKILNTKIENGKKYFLINE